MGAPFWFLPDNPANSAGAVPPSSIRSNETKQATPALSLAEARIVEHIRAGETATFERLFRNYYKDLYRYATSLTRDPEVAEDIVADVFVYVWERRAVWHVHDSIRAHLFAAVRYRVLHWHRRMRLETRHAISITDVLDMDVTLDVPADQALEWDEVVRIVRVAIDRLPPRTREAYVLHRQDELSYAEVAQVMGTSAKTVEKQVATALKALRATLRTFRE